MDSRWVYPTEASMGTILVVVDEQGFFWTLVADLLVTDIGKVLSAGDDLWTWMWFL